MVLRTGSSIAKAIMAFNASEAVAPRHFRIILRYYGSLLADARTAPNWLGQHLRSYILNGHKVIIGDELYGPTALADLQAKTFLHPLEEILKFLRDFMMVALTSFGLLVAGAAVTMKVPILGVVVVGMIYWSVTSYLSGDVGRIRSRLRLGNPE